MSEAIAVSGRFSRVFSVPTVVLLMRKELRDSLRSRWMLLYTLAFSALAVSLSYMSVVGTGAAGFAGFGRTAAG